MSKIAIIAVEPFTTMRGQANAEIGELGFGTDGSGTNNLIVKTGDKVMISGFGVGLSGGGCVLNFVNRYNEKENSRNL